MPRDGAGERMARLGLLWDDKTDALVNLPIGADLRWTGPCTTMSGTTISPRERHSRAGDLKGEWPPIALLRVRHLY